MPAQPEKCPLLARVKSLPFLLNAAGGEGKIIFKAIKRLSKRCSWEKWEEAQMKCRFRMLKIYYFIQISWMVRSFRLVLPPEPQPALNQLSISSRSLFFALRDQECTIMGFFSPLHNKIGRLSSSFYSDFRKAFLFYF